MSAEHSHNDTVSSSSRTRRPVGIKEQVRRSVVNTMYRVGLVRCVERVANKFELSRAIGSRLPNLRRRVTPKFAVLCYHRVGTDGVPLFSRLKPSEFEAQMRYLTQHYRVVSLDQLCSELREARLVEPTVAVTFDDGYRDLYTHAFPALQKYAIPATVYLIGRCMETGEPPWYDRIFVAVKNAPGNTLDVPLDRLTRFELGSGEDRLQIVWQIVCYLRTIPDHLRRAWCARFEQILPVQQTELEERMLNWEQVRAMQKGGLFIGAHTMSHPAVSQLDPSDFEEELARSKRLLEERLGVPVADFAYPFGKLSDVSPAAEAFLARSGYRSAVTTLEGCNLPTTNPFRLRRIQVDDSDSMASFALTLGRVFLEYPDPLETDNGTDELSRQVQQSRCEV
jgi:peptidoglycan/xylan/chitin deacetylase (PgdA/CDA1 family)